MARGGKVALGMEVDAEVKATIERLARQARLSQVRIVEQAVMHAASCWQKTLVVELRRARERVRTKT